MLVNMYIYQMNLKTFKKEKKKEEHLMNLLDYKICLDRKKRTFNKYIRLSNIFKKEKRRTLNKCIQTRKSALVVLSLFTSFSHWKCNSPQLLMPPASKQEAAQFAFTYFIFHLYQILSDFRFRYLFLNYLWCPSVPVR